MSETAKKPNVLKRIARSFRDMKGEVKKVAWPSKKQILNNTGVVIMFVVIAGAVVGGLDMLLTALVDMLLKSI